MNRRSTMDDTLKRAALKRARAALEVATVGEADTPGDLELELSALRLRVENLERRFVERRGTESPGEALQR